MDFTANIRDVQIIGNRPNLIYPSGRLRHSSGWSGFWVIGLAKNGFYRIISNGVFVRFCKVQSFSTRVLNSLSSTLYSRRLTFFILEHTHATTNHHATSLSPSLSLNFFYLFQISSIFLIDCSFV